MVALRLDSVLARRSSAQRAAVYVSAGRQDAKDHIWGRGIVDDEPGSLLKRDDDKDDDKDDDHKFNNKGDDDFDDDDDFTSFPPPPPGPPTLVPPASLTTSSSTASTTSTTLSESESEPETKSETKSASTTLSIPPILTSTVTTPTSSPQTTAPPGTGFPLLTSSLALPAATSSGAAFIGAPGGQDTGRREGERGRNGGRPRGTSYEVGIAFGVLAAVGLIVGLIWVAILIRRRRHRRGQDEVNSGDYHSRIGQQRRFNFKFPSVPALPFSFTTPLERFYKPKPEAIPQRHVSNPFNAKHVNGNRNERSDSSILNEAIQAAYQIEGGHGNAVPRGFLDEKRRGPDLPLPLLDPAPVEQASIRRSVVSWFKRSSRHHPLKLNPFSGSGSMRSSTGSILTGGRRSRPGSQATQRTASYYSNPGDSAAMDSSSGVTGMQDAPPLPDLGLQKDYLNNTAPRAPSPTGSTAESTAESVAAPLPVFTRDDAQAYYKSMRATSVSASTERMSAMSSWTDATRTTMAGGRSSAMNTPGLSPPPSFHSSSDRTSAYPQTPTTPGFAGTPGPSPGEGTRTREELYTLYTHTRASIIGSAVGLGLPPQQQQQQQQEQEKPAGTSGNTK